MELSDQNKNKFGAIIGRYVFSEHGDSPMNYKKVFHINSNILQYPVVGDILLGFE